MNRWNVLMNEQMRKMNIIESTNILESLKIIHLSMIWKQWMTISSFVPCYPLHVPQHVAVSPFGPLKQIFNFVRPICRNSLFISGLGISRGTGFNLEFPSPRWIAGQGLGAPSTLFMFCLETYKRLVRPTAMTMRVSCLARFV